MQGDGDDDSELKCPMRLAVTDMERIVKCKWSEMSDPACCD